MTTDQFMRVAYHMDDVAREMVADAFSPCPPDKFWGEYKKAVCGQSPAGEQHCKDLLELAGVREATDPSEG